MATTFVCDRCGHPADVVITLQARKSSPREIKLRFTTADLCHRCEQSLYDWMADA
jgi:transcription elongation factor Elf1